MRGGDGRVLHDKAVGEVEELGCLLKGGFRSRLENQGSANQGANVAHPPAHCVFCLPLYYNKV